MDDLLLNGRMNGGAAQLDKMLNSNSYTSEFGVVLSEKEALILMDERREILKEQERVEFGGGILEQLLFAFCDSPYVFQDNYLEIIGRLQLIFYSYKNESMDLMTDDELIEAMKKGFDGVCQGDLDYLEGTYMDKLARQIRGGDDE